MEVNAVMYSHFIYHKYNKGRTD